MTLGTFISGFKDIYKGVPQGSILGQVIYFINDIFCFVTDSDLNDYADDNSVSYSHHDPQVLKSALTKDNLIRLLVFRQSTAGKSRSLFLDFIPAPLRAMKPFIRKKMGHIT